MTSPLDTLSPAERAWLIEDEKRWRRAHEIATNRGLDASGIYHVLRNLEKTPSQRLRDGLRHGRPRRVHGR